MDEQKLLPCPFCGGEADGPTPNGEFPDLYDVWCAECCATVMGDTPDEAIAAWNTRPAE
jgi:hypothetical protein